MIHIEKDQLVSENQTLKVATATGDYDDNALIEVYDVSNPGVITGSFHAQYIAYGGLVYRYNSAKELGEEILKIDPQSTHTSASYVRMSNELLEKMDGGTLEVDSLDEVISTEQTKIEQQRIEPVDVVEEEETNENLDEVPQETPVVETEGEVEGVNQDDSEVVEPSDDGSVPEVVEPEVLIPPSDPLDATEVIIPDESTTNNVVSMLKKRKKGKIQSIS
ncbi:MAG: hypothetical protein KBC42_03575 [Candidatus Pacebacteria bacterium]|nr:hypothetical protein [Candidatus Paceibacterota bacterium]MBP9780976.1 hypothetical protein [Candidatus Paceibacterota bacterium]